MRTYQDASNYFLDVYKHFSIDVDRGKEAYLYDKDGSKYLDFLAGIAVNALGYNHPQIIKAITGQLHRNLHLSNYYVQDIQLDFAKKLLRMTPFSKLFLTNSGAEAIEGLLKVVKKWGNERNKSEIIAFEGSFHGRSIGALSLTIQDKYQKSFLPLLPNIVTVPRDNIDAFEKAVNERTAAVFFEGVSGEGGVKPLTDPMVKVMKVLKEKFDYLLIADEIQTGVGRTGTFYYFEQMGIIPDGIATAKALGGGLPLGAFLLSDNLANIFSPGEHGTTYGGNPLACAAGLASINIISEDNFLDNISKNGKYFREQLRLLAKDHGEIITDIRGKGLMIGVEVGKYAQPILKEAFNQGMLFNIAGGNTLRFVPPLIINRGHIDEAISKLRETFKLLF
jgi:predicted acetylornithine/succinylornithine family transaminase